MIVLDGKYQFLARLESSGGIVDNCSLSDVDRGYCKMLSGAVVSGFDKTYLKPLGRAMLASYRDGQRADARRRRVECIRYAITTGIALLALLLSVIAILSESQVLPLRELLGLPPLP